MDNTQDMVGVVLAAGVGSRLRPLTKDKSKCLVKTAGKPILEYQIEAYKEAGIKELVIVVGYEGTGIKEYCKHIKDIKITIVDNDDYESTNNMYSLYLTMEYVRGREFILNNADLSIDRDIVKCLLEFGKDNAIAVDSSLFNDESMKVSVNKKGVITDISKQITQENSFACSIDFYKFSAESSRIFFDEISRIIEVEKNKKDWTEVAMQRLFRSKQLEFHTCDILGKKWVEIDNYNDLALSDRIFSGFDEVIDGIESILFDLDGTIYLGNTLIKGAKEAIDHLVESGKKVFFLSNNSSKCKSDYVRYLVNFGLKVTKDQIVLSTDAVVDFLNDEKVLNIHIVGTNSLKKVFIDSGFCIDSDRPEYVVLGYDTELNYSKLVTACKYINQGVDIIATHCDMFCPSENGPIPDVGSLIEMIRMTTGKSPVKVFGKPTKYMATSIVRNFNIDLSKTLMVGDRLYTDIKMAKNISSFSLLVLSGETTRDCLDKSDIQPDFVLNSVADFQIKQ